MFLRRDSENPVRGTTLRTLEIRQIKTLPDFWLATRGLAIDFGQGGMILKRTWFFYSLLTALALALSSCGFLAEEESNDETLALAVAALAASQQSPASATTTSNECSSCVIYETSGTFSASAIASIENADSICNSDANKPNGGTYKAWLGSSSRSGGIFRTSGVSYVRTDGAVLATSTVSDFFIWEAGGSLTGQFIVPNCTGGGLRWIGVPGSASTSTETCSDWTSNGANGRVADRCQQVPDALQGRAVNNQSCSTTRPILCVQQTNAAN